MTVVVTEFQLTLSLQQWDLKGARVRQLLIALGAKATES